MRGERCVTERVASSDEDSCSTGNSSYCQKVEIKQMETQTQYREACRAPYNGRLTFYHPNSGGTGTAMQLELKLNRKQGDRYDCFFLEVARQKTRSSNGTEGRVPASFDWDQKATVKLGFLDVCEMLTVLEGLKDSAGGNRNGIYHESGETNTIISLKRTDGREGYYMGVSRKSTNGSQIFKGGIALSQAEAVGLRSIFQTGLFYMVFRENVR